MIPAHRYDSLFQFYAEEASVRWSIPIDWRDLKAQAQAESGEDLNPDAESRVGAKGLAQFMTKTWEEWKDGLPGIQDPPAGFFDPRDPEDAIRAQAHYMGWLMRQMGQDLNLALAAYNWGIGNVIRGLKAGTVPGELPEETSKYLLRIARYRARMDEEEALARSPSDVEPKNG